MTMMSSPHAPIPADARLWRRGPAPVPAGSHDYGYFGPGSVVWQVVTHPATALMTAQVTAAFEVRHKGIQAATLQHDPLILDALKGKPAARLFVTRFQRTLGVPLPIVLGDTATADQVAGHLRRVHARITGTMPGTDGERYSAGSPENALFAHVTIFHAALRSYEKLAYRDRHAPRRLPDAERDRYFRELVPFAELMGVEPGTAPASMAAVVRYYRSIENDYGPIPGFQEAQLPVALGSLRIEGRHEIGSAAAAVAMGSSMALAVAVAPRPVRRLLGVPAVFDPALAAALRAARPTFAALALPTVGDRAVRAIAGPEGLELTRAARRTMRAHR